MIIKYIGKNIYSSLSLNGIYPVLSFEKEKVLIADVNNLIWILTNDFQIIKNCYQDYAPEKNKQSLTYTHQNIVNREFLLKYYLEEDEYEEIVNLILTTEREIFVKECVFEELFDYLKNSCNNNQIYYILLESILTKIERDNIERFIKVLSNILCDFEEELLKRLIYILIKYSTLPVFNIICEIYSTKKIEDKNIVLSLENYIMNYS